MSDIDEMTARATLEVLWARHSTIRVGGQLGMGGLGRVFWCDGCRVQWPCPDAKVLMQWGQIGPADDWEPLTLVEKAIDGGSGEVRR